MEDSEFMVPLLGTCLEFQRGSKPCSRKYFGCTYCNGRFYACGGMALKLLQDLKSFSLWDKTWRLETDPHQR